MENTDPIVKSGLDDKSLDNETSPEVNGLLS